MRPPVARATRASRVSRISHTYTLLFFSTPRSRVNLGSRLAFLRALGFMSAGAAKQTSLLGFFSKAPKQATPTKEAPSTQDPSSAVSTPPPTAERSSDASSSKHELSSPTPHVSRPAKVPRMSQKTSSASSSLTPPPSSDVTMTEETAPSSSPTQGRRRAARRINYSERYMKLDEDDDLSLIHI